VPEHRLIGGAQPLELKHCDRRETNAIGVSLVRSEFGIHLCRARSMLHRPALGELAHELGLADIA
jgi:hypothetical protein